MYSTSVGVQVRNVSGACARPHRRGYFHRSHADGTSWSGRRIRSSPSCHIYHQTGFNSCTDIHVKTTSLVAVCALWKEKKVVVARVRVTVFHNFSWLYSSVQKNCIDSVGVLRAIPGGRKILSVPILQYTKFCQLFIYAIGFSVRALIVRYTRKRETRSFSKIATQQSGQFMSTLWHKKLKNECSPWCAMK